MPNHLSTTHGEVNEYGIEKKVGQHWHALQSVEKNKKFMLGLYLLGGIKARPTFVNSTYSCLT